ncbi:hypothetical protein C7B80_25100 [Cyanosarcina cf. burmensis CCALA 770]|nr:hypothetical protein C7B80_25100 [Cyanosarcina cf. burmensis CCALA 770]
MSPNLPELKTNIDRTPLWLKLIALMLLITLGVNLLALRQEPKYLIQTSPRQLSQAVSGREHNILIQSFVRDILSLTYAYSKKKSNELKTNLGKDDTMVFGNLQVWIPNAIATYAMDVELQSTILKGLSEQYYPRIAKLNASEVAFRPTVISTPIQVKEGVWQVIVIAGRFFMDDRGQLLFSEPYNARVTVRSVDPPLKPLGAVSEYDELVYQSRQSGYEITAIHVVKDESELDRLMESK